MEKSCANFHIDKSVSCNWNLWPGWRNMYGGICLAGPTLTDPLINQLTACSCSRSAGHWEKANSDKAKMIPIFDGQPIKVVVDFWLGSTVNLKQGSYWQNRQVWKCSCDTQCHSQLLVIKLRLLITAPFGLIVDCWLAWLLIQNKETISILLWTTIFIHLLWNEEKAHAAQQGALGH